MRCFPGVPYIAFYPGSLNGPLAIALPSSIASVPVFSSQLSDHMTLWGRAQNFFYSFMAPVGRSVLMWKSTGVKFAQFIYIFGDSKHLY